VIVRFFLLSTETSVLVFGLAFGHLDSHTSIRRVLLVTSFISLAYSICQGCLEIVAPDESFYIKDRDYYLFSHGGMIFWFCTCLLFAIIYATVFLLPWTPCRQRIPLPNKEIHFFCLLLKTSFISVLFFNLIKLIDLCVYSKLISYLYIAYNYYKKQNIFHDILNQTIRRAVFTQLYKNPFVSSLAFN